MMPTPIRTRPLGRTGLAVSELGFGAAPLGDLYAILDEQVARDTVRAAVDAGVTLFDVAPLYGHGLAEQRLGSVLRDVPREKYVLSTKVGRWMDPRQPRSDGSGYTGGLRQAAVIDYSYDGTMRAFDQSLSRLGVDSVDIVLIHDVDVRNHGANRIDARFREAMEGAYRALEALRAAGTVRAIGVGVNEAEMCERFATAGEFDCMLLAGRYTLLEQGPLDGFMKLAHERKIGVLLGGVFNSGILATGPVPGAKYDYADAPPDVLARVQRIDTVCRAHGVPLAVAAARFPLGHPAVASVVLGAVSPAEVTHNVAALSMRVPAALWSDLVAEGLLRADAPAPQ